jgi:hypothetical protein
MPTPKLQTSMAVRIERLQRFKKLLQQWRQSPTDELRSQISEQKQQVRRDVIEAGCLKRMNIAPPPAVGGLILRNIDPFDMIFRAPWGLSLVRDIQDMIDEAIGAIQTTPSSVLSEPRGQVRDLIRQNYAFVAMPIDPDDPSNVDVLDAIKESCQRCGIQAERVDDVQSNERITDRTLESLRRAEFVIADLSNAKPNVYYEAGYAHALGKTPIFLAKAGSKLEFDLKDFPVIFFKNLKQLKDELERRLRALANARQRNRRAKRRVRHA